jgi:CDP-diacylglycerol pyrophosphatase
MVATANRAALPGQGRDHRNGSPRFARRGLRSLLVAALVALAVSFTASAEAAGRRDLLWGVISNCLDPAAANYCSNCQAPLAGSACAAKPVCQESTEVWAKTEAFVALRDRKMCDCPEGFVHGLAVPRARVTGVEDPRRPVGIWDFAWTAAANRIGDQSAAALAVNPAAMRSQDQLHVHIVRLAKDARQRFTTARTARVQTLDEVWGTASRVAADAGLKDYGVLVARHPEGGFLVLVDPTSPEKDYTVERCR